jgi:hypothetical protein
MYLRAPGNGKGGKKTGKVNEINTENQNIKTNNSKAQVKQKNKTSQLLIPLPL